MARRRVKPALVEREVLAAIKFYMEHGWSWASVVAFLADKAMWREIGGAR
jgi:hypothetical protein